MEADVKLKDIYIGYIDGETESSREGFEQLFYTNNSKYDEIMNPEKFIISGRKGTGKTILANYIYKKVNKNENYICKIFKKHDFHLQKLIDLQYRQLQEEELTIFWKWVLLLQISDLILSKETFKTKIPFTAERKLKKFIKTKYPDDIFKIKEFSKGATKKISLGGKVSSSSELNPALSATKEEQEQVNFTYGNKEYFELVRTLENLVTNCLLKKNEIVIIFDDIDEIEDRIEKKGFYFKLLISMLETIKSLNLMFQSINKVSSKIIILLRSDIIDQIHSYSSNSNKLITEGQVSLYWIAKNYDSPADHPLMEMILNKIQKSVPLYNSTDKYSLLKLLFPNKISSKDTIDYLLDYSFGRPRDIIRYLNIIINRYPESTTFTPKHFKECTQEYSKWFFNELENEISIHAEKDVITDGLKLLNDYKKNTFSFEMIEEFFNNYAHNYPSLDNLKDTLAYLYKFGVIGNSWLHARRKNRNIYHYSWGYREDSVGEVNFSQSFVVHYGFKKYFSL